MKFRYLPLTAALCASVAGVQTAAAAVCPSNTFCRSDTVTNVGSPASPVVTATGFPDNGPIGSQTSFTLGNAFGPGQTTLGSDFITDQTGAQAPGATGTDSGWNFYDDFRFTVSPGSSFNTAVISLNNPFGAPAVSSLEVRLFDAGPNGTAPNSPPTLGSPTGGTIIDVWSGPLAGGVGSFLITLPTTITANSYDLQFRGKADNGSSYGGNINFSPVPLPAAGWLMLSALAGISFLGWRVRREGGLVSPLQFA